MQSAIFGIAGTIIGTMLGAWVTYRFAIKLANINTKRIAGIRLRDAFMSELAQIHNPDNNDIVEILESGFNKHQAAVYEFKFSLSDKTTFDAFDNAWYQYRADPKTKKKSLVQYSEFFDKDGIYPKSAREMAIDRIEAILAFTKDTRR